MKKINIFLIIVLIILAFLGGYLMVGGEFNFSDGSITGTLLSRFSNEPVEIDQGITPNQDNQDELISLSDRAVVSITNSSDKNSVLYYEKNTGKLFELNIQTKNEKVISDKITPNFLSAIWSPTKDESILNIYSQENNRFKHINILTGIETDYDPNIRSVAFSPDGTLVSYYYLSKDASSSGVGEIFIAQPDNSFRKSLLKTRIGGLVLNWPLKDKVALKTVNFEVFLLNENGELEKIAEARPGYEDSWSRNGNKVLFSMITDTNGSLENLLSVKDVTVAQEYQLDTAGRASQCVWSVDNINVYCVVAKNPSVDEVYKINTQDKTKKVIAEPGIKLGEMIISSLEDYLIFTDIKDNRLYKIKITD